MVTIGGALSVVDDTTTDGSRATTGAATGRDRLTAALATTALDRDFAAVVEDSAVFKTFNAFFADFAARLASLNFCLACLKPALAVLAAFLAASACFCAVEICARIFCLVAAIAPEVFVVMG